MSHLRDFGKVASGLAMVVKESVTMAPRLRLENVGGAAFDILRAVTGTVTDLTGLTLGRVKELQRSDELGHRRERETRAGSSESTSSAAGSGRDSYLLNTLDSLGPPRSRLASASDRTDEVLERVKEEILPVVAETPMSKPLEKFTSVDSDPFDNASPSRKEESKLDSQAIKAEQVLQASQKSGAFVSL